MRKRLIITFLVLALSIIAAYAIPRATMVSDFVYTSETQRAERVADALSVLISEREKTEPASAGFIAPLLQSGERAEYVAADGSLIIAGVPATTGDLQAQAQTASGGTVTFSLSEDLIAQRIGDVLWPIVIIASLLVVLSVIVAIVLGMRMSRPFVQLAEIARGFGRGRFSMPAADFRIPEAQAIKIALRESADTLERRIRREHEFAANASHQLRTPITAMRLELEDLTLWPQTPPDVRDQLNHAIREIDRLTDAITQLLELARSESINTDASVPLAEMLRDAATRWTPQATIQNRRIVIGDIDAALGSAPTAASQILDVLLHNALVHGRGTVTITGLRRAGYSTVQVSDEGKRPGGNVVFERRPDKRSATSGEGIGLALSAEIAESLGGHLLLDGDETTTFSLMLPARETAEGDPSHGSPGLRASV